MDIAGDDELLALLKQAGVNRVYLGIESLRQESLENFNKISRVEDIRLAVRKIRSFGIEVWGLFVFGDDEFNKGDGKQVAEFVIREGVTGVLLQPLTPFPGTKLFDRLKSEGRILHENWEEYNGKVVFAPKRLTAAELQDEIYQCYRRVYSPWRVFKYLLFGKRGLKLGVLGEAAIRRVEQLKCRNYIRDKLLNQGRFCHLN